MTSQAFCRWVCGAAVFIGVGLQSTWAQDESYGTYERNDPFGARPRPHTDATRVDLYSRPQLAEVAVGTLSFGRGPDSKSAIRDAAKELRDAKGDEAKDKAEANLRDLLSKYFDEDMKQREAALKEMEARLSKLKERLAKRHDKMQEIVDLQIKVLINEADGLGFFSGEPAFNGSPLNPRSAAPGPYDPQFDRIILHEASHTEPAASDPVPIEREEASNDPLSEPAAR
jgi:hypothetical protein